MLKSIKTSYKECPIDVSFREFMSITKGLMGYIAEQVLDGERVRLPAGMGDIEVVGKKVKPRISEDGEILGLAPDWVKTKELWKRDPQAKAEKRRIYHFNEHTNSVRYKLYWDKRSYNHVNKVLYHFLPVRSLKRGIWKKIMTNDKEYRIEI